MTQRQIESDVKKVKKDVAYLLYINSTGGGVPGSGTVTSVSVVSVNGLAGSVANATSVPSITLTTSVIGLLKGNGTAISAATAGTDYLTPSGSAAALTSFPTFNQSTTGNAATATNVAYLGLTGTVPTWNQNTTGSATTLSANLPVSKLNSGTNASSTTFWKGDGTWDSVNVVVTGVGTGQAVLFESGTDILFHKAIGTSTFISSSTSSNTILLSLSATGTPSSSTYLRGDNTWATIGGSGITTLNTLTGATQTFSSTGITITSATTNHAFSNDLITGKAGGQTITGGTAASESLTFLSTAHATKGTFIFGSTSKMVYDSNLSSLRLGTPTDVPGFDLQVANFMVVGRNSATPISKFTFSNNSTGSTGIGFYTSTDVLQGLLRANGPSIGTTLAGISKNNMFEYLANSGALMLYGAGNVYLATNGTTPALTALTTGKIGLNGITTPTAWLHFPAGTATAGDAPIKLTTGPVTTVAVAGQMEYTTPQLFFTNGGAQRQELFQGQQSRVSTQFDATSNTTLANITGLTATLVAGKFYRFVSNLYTTSNSAGGVKVAIAGTATATAIVYEGLTRDAGATTQSRGTALATTVGAVTAVTAAYIKIEGTITCNVGGTLTVQFAQNASNGTASSVLVGSTFVVTEIA